MNWGTKIIMGMVAFMLFIVGMVVYMFSLHGKDAMVDEDYYEKGIHYDQEYDASKNVINDSATPKITINKNQIIIQLKDSASYALKLMRPSTVKDNIVDEGFTKGDANLILVDASKMHSGLWFLELKWNCNNKAYQYKKRITR
ncbi:MAG: nitrogen fixation protein FixH [Sphingobacteriales bacterium]|nr:MAG: nitrogen fixation protein FixH [Sphingobacteriales bacterium]